MIKFLTILKEKFPGILEEYKRTYQEIKTKQKVSISPLIDREYMEVDHPEIAPLLKKLEEMGFYFFYLSPPIIF